MFTITGPSSASASGTYRPTSNSAPPITCTVAMTCTQCDCMNTAINCPASPVGIGPIGKNGCNPFAPKKTNVNPNNTRAIITAFFIAFPPSEVQDVFFDAQAGYSGAGIKSRSDIGFEGNPSPPATICTSGFMPLLRLTEYRHPSDQFLFRQPACRPSNTEYVFC